METKVYNNKTKKSDSKTVYKTKLETREDFIKKFKKERFEEMCKKDERYAKLQDLPPPKSMVWIFSHFLKLYRHCQFDISGNPILTPKQILEYSECFGVKFSYYERSLILKMKEWAAISIRELHNQKD